MMSLEETIKHAEYIVNNRKDAISVCWSVKECKQIADWLRELQERRKVDSCEGCMHRYGEKLSCQMCARYYRDKYVAERRTE